MRIRTGDTAGSACDGANSPFASAAAFTVTTCRRAFRWFPDEGWPDNLIPPTEGSLDQPTACRLIAHLANAGRSTECIAAYTFLAAGWKEDTNPCFAGPVDRLRDLCERGLGTPSNFWPIERSWFVYSNWDLWVTKVSGPTTLIAALEADAELETITWPDPEPAATEP